MKFSISKMLKIISSVVGALLRRLMEDSFNFGRIDFRK
jgi:hypothetical protein